MDRIVITRTYTATYTGKSEFYSGIGFGDKVVVEEEVVTYSFEGRRLASVSVRAQAHGGPWLVINDIRDLIDVEPALAELGVHE